MKNVNFQKKVYEWQNTFNNPITFTENVNQISKI
jgi:hypothetical protein